MNLRNALLVFFIMFFCSVNVFAENQLNDPSTNLALSATATASSTYNSNYAASKVKDGIISIWDTGEWASNGEGAGAWVKLTWGTAQTMNEVWIYSRPNEYDRVTDSWLDIDTNNDETAEESMHIGMLPDGGAPKILYLSKTAYWIRVSAALGREPIWAGVAL